MAASAEPWQAVYKAAEEAVRLAQAGVLVDGERPGN